MREFESVDAMTSEAQRRIHRRIERIQSYYSGRGRLFKALWLVVAVLVVAAGLLMSVLPGPAVIVLPIGLAMLAVQFGWARRLLNVSIDRSMQAAERVGALAHGKKLLWAAALILLIAAIGAWLVLQ